MFGWSRPAAAWASRRKRSRSSGVERASGRGTFSATSRPQARVAGQVDDAEAAAAQLAEQLEAADVGWRAAGWFAGRLVRRLKPAEE